MPKVYESCQKNIFMSYWFFKISIKCFITKTIFYVSQKHRKHNFKKRSPEIKKKLSSNSSKIIFFLLERKILNRFCYKFVLRILIHRLPLFYHFIDLAKVDFEKQIILINNLDTHEIKCLYIFFTQVKPKLNIAGK